MAKSITLLVIVASLSTILLVGISISAAAGLSPASNYNSGSSYKKMTCLDKVLEFGQEGIVRDAGGFNGALFECSQIQWSGSIYALVAK
ncbi:MAG: hypothetical protein ACJ71O_17485 [Nitrososphaeraceae archaeon]